MEQAFCNVGLSLAVDGSADHELNIKGFYEIDIRDWTFEIKVDTHYADVEDKGLESIEFVADEE